MKNIFICVLSVCMVLVLFDCKEADNDMNSEPVIIPEKYQGKWYKDGELVCDIFTDKIIFYQFPVIDLSESNKQLFVGKFFDISLVNALGFLFDASIVTNNTENVVIVRLEDNYLFVGLGVPILIEGKESLVIAGHFYLDRGEQ